LGIQGDELASLALAGALHNIGYLAIPEEVAFTNAELSEEKLKQIKKHTTEGARLLKKANLPEKIVRTAAEHHEYFSGKGYPGVKSGDEIHLFAKLCCIIDVYDAMRSVRPYEQDYPKTQVLELMKTMNGKFDPKLLDKFFQFEALLN